MANLSANKQLSDEELAVQAQAGSHPCFEELVYRYGQRLFHFLRAKMPTDQDTEDLVQETFLKVYRNIRRFDLNYKFSTWLYTTAARLAISHFRKKRIDKYESTVEVPYASPDPRQQMIARDNTKNIWHASRCLGQNQYQALWLRYIEDMPVKEIAVVLNKTRLHVRVLLHLARLKLAKKIKRPAFTGEIEETAPAAV